MIQRPTPNSAGGALSPMGWADTGTVAAMQPGAFWAKITGNAAGTNRYAWTQIDTGDTAAFDTGLSDDFAATGTSAETGAPAYEVNGRTDVATGTRVLLYPMGDLTYYGFAAPATNGAASYLAPVRVATTTAGTLATSFENGDTVDGVALATGDAILIKDQSLQSENGTYTVNASGAPTRRETLGAQFYGALVAVTNGVTNGDSLWQCTNDTVPAVGSSAIQWSRVSGASGTGTDNRIARWDGTSAIQDSDIAITDAGNFVMGSGVAYFGGASSIPPAGGGAAFGFGGIEFGSACDISNVNDISGTGDFITDGTSATNGGLVRGVFVEALGVPASVAGHSIKLVTSTADGTPPQIQVTVRNVGGLSRTAYTGYSGTPGPGFTTHGGVVTSAGSGTFGDVVTTAANAFTNTNTFTPASTSGVPLIVKGLASQTGDLLQAQDSAATVRARIEPDGEIEAASGAARLNVSSSNGQLALFNNAGSTYATLTAGASNVLTTSAGFTTGGALTVSSGGLTVTSGGATITAGGLTVSAGGANITGTVTGTAFSGSGAALTTLSASNVSSGTLAVDYGGTGRTSHTAYAVLCGGTTSTGAQQSIASVGTSGQVLTSNGAGALPTFEDPAVPASGAALNLLRNGAATVYQRGAAASGADGTYGVDGFYHLVQTAAVAQDRGTNLNPYWSVRLTQSQVTAQRMGLAQAVEAADSLPYRSRSVRFQFRALASTSTAIRFAILEWTGTGDSITKDCVNDWTSGTYTTGNFFVGSGYTVVAVGSGTATTTAADFSVTGTVSASVSNLIVFVWTENTVAQSVTLEVTKCGLYDGTDARDWLPRSLAEELAFCQRLLWKRANATLGQALNGTSLYSGGLVPFPTEMRTAPSVSGASFTVNAGNAGTPSFSITAQGFVVANSGAVWTATAFVTLNGALFSAEL